MPSKTVIKPVETTGLSSTFNKIFNLRNHFTMATVVLGSTLGAMNAAHSADIIINDAETKVIADIDDANADDNLVFKTAGDHVINTAGGTIMNVVNISSITGNSAVAITGTGSLVASGNAASTDSLIITVATGANLSIAGNTTGAQPFEVITAGAGEITLNGGAQALAGIFDSDGNFGGKMIISNAGTKTFAEATGGANRFGTITTDAAATAVFGSTSATTTLANSGTTTLTGAASVNTINNAGALTVTSTVDGVAGGGADTTINLTATDASVLFNGTTALAYDMVIAAGTDGFGTINFIDSADDEAATNTTAGGDIGANTLKVGTINIGSATKAGNLTTIAGDLIFASAINVTGGNVTAEASALDIAASIGDADDLVAIVLDDNAGNAMLDIGATASIFGTIDGSATAGAGTSRIDANAATTFEGNIGENNAVEELEIGAASNLKGAIVTATATNFDADVALSIGGAVAQTIDTVFTFDTLEEGTINVSNTAGLVTFKGVIGTTAARAKEIVIADDADATFEAAIFANTLDINTAAADDIITFTTGGHIIGDAGATADAVQIAGGTIVLGTDIEGGTTVFDIKTVKNDSDGLVIAAAVNIKPAATFQTGVITLFDGVDGTAYYANTAEENFVTVSDTALTKYTVSRTAALKGDTFITATAKTGDETAAALGVDTNTGTALQQIMAAANTAADATLISTLSDALTEVNGGLLSDAIALSKQAAPQTEMISGGTVASKAVTNSVQGIISNRMASLRSGDAFATGMSAGSGMSAKSGFLQVFGSTAEQGDRTVGSGTSFGFDADSSGVAIGFDGISDSGTTVGLSLSMANTDLDGKGTGKASTDIDTYTASIYMDKATDTGYIEGSLTYGMSENTTSRSITAAGLNRVLSAAYDSEQVSLNVGAGMPNELSVGYLTPFASFTSTVISTDTYTEKSTVANDALRLKVNQDDLTSMVGSVGVKYHNVMDNGGTPMISLAINNEFGDANIKSANNYTGGGSVFNTQNAVEELSATLGVGYAFGNDYTSISFAYEADANDDKYLSHGGSIKLVGKF
jgi:uncharacterized protein with beta-barrel porin domain